jgi:hypothetical protein
VLKGVDVDPVLVVIAGLVAAAVLLLAAVR